jgi:hypothetical protein
VCVIGLATEFRSEKIPRNRLGTASVFPRKKMLIPRHSEVYGRVYSEARNGRKWHERVSFTKNPAPANIMTAYLRPRHSSERNSELFSLSRNCSDRNSDSLHLILFYSKEFRAFFSSVERFGTEFREFSVPWNSRNSAGTNQLFRLFRLPRNNFIVGNCQP